MNVIEMSRRRLTVLFVYRDDHHQWREAVADNRQLLDVPVDLDWFEPLHHIQHGHSFVNEGEHGYVVLLGRTNHG